LPAERRALPGKDDLRAITALVLVQVFFGAFSVVGKIALREMTPFVLASFRAIFGALLLGLLARALAPPEPPPTWRDRRDIALLALFGIVGNQLLFMSGLARTTAVHATLLGVTIPLFTLGLSLGLRRERADIRKALGLALALAGVLLLLDVRGGRMAGGSLAGDLLVLLNCASYSVFLVLARDVLARRSALSVIASAFRYGAVPILLVGASDLASFRPAGLSRSAWVALAFIVVFATVGSYLLNAWALSRTSPSTTALFIYLQPLVAALLAHAFLGERISSVTLVAAGLIFAGLALPALSARRPAVNRG